MIEQAGGTRKDEERKEKKKKESRTAYNELACSAADNVFRRRMLMAAGDQEQPFHFFDLFVFVVEFNKLERGGVFGASAAGRRPSGGGK